jgi:hypothetical protein
MQKGVEYFAIFSARQLVGDEGCSSHWSIECWLAGGALELW